MPSQSITSKLQSCTFFDWASNLEAWLLALSGPRAAGICMKEVLGPVDSGTPTRAVGAEHGSELPIKDLLHLKSTSLPCLCKELVTFPSVVAFALSLRRSEVTPL